MKQRRLSLREQAVQSRRVGQQSSVHWRRPGSAREVRQYRTTRRGPTACIGSSASPPRLPTLRSLWPRGRRQSSLDRAADRRERHREGPGRRDHSLRERSCVRAVHEHHVLGASRAAARERTVRSRARGLHGRPDAKKGLFEAADGGTVFLDEIGEMTPATSGEAPALPGREELQARRRFQDIHVDVRVIAATNRNLGDTKSINTDSALISSSASMCCQSTYCLCVPGPTISPSWSSTLSIRSTPSSGNVCTAQRLRRTPCSNATAGPATCASCATSSSARCYFATVTASMRETSRVTAGVVQAGDEFELPAAGVDLERLERSLVVQALKRSGGNQTRAGTFLGLNRDQIRYRIEKYGLTTTP